MHFGSGGVLKLTGEIGLFAQNAILTTLLCMLSLVTRRSSRLSIHASSKHSSRWHAPQALKWMTYDWSLPEWIKDNTPRIIFCRLRIHRNYTRTLRTLLASLRVLLNLEKKKKNLAESGRRYFELQRLRRMFRASYVLQGRGRDG